MPETTNPFAVGDRVYMKLAGPGVADVTVKALGVCDEEETDGFQCGKPTIIFDDPQSGETDEGHAEDFGAV